MNAALQPLIARELELDEKIVYQAQPDPKRAAQGFGWLVFIGWLIGIFAELPLLLLAFYLATGLFIKLIPIYGDGGRWQILGNATDLGTYFAAFLVTALLVLLLGSFVAIMIFAPQMTAKTATITAYLVTNRRAIILRLLGGSHVVQSYSRSQFTEFERIENADGSGTIYFISDYRLGHRKEKVEVKKVGFENILNVREAERALSAMD
jgi:hypothetical protein